MSELHYHYANGLRWCITLLILIVHTFVHPYFCEDGQYWFLIIIAQMVYVCVSVHSFFWILWCCMMNMRMINIGSASPVYSWGCLRSVASMKLQVSFAEYRLFCRALLQKRPMIWSILLTKATPYTHEDGWYFGASLSFSGWSTLLLYYGYAGGLRLRTSILMTMINILVRRCLSKDDEYRLFTMGWLWLVGSIKL